MQANGLAPDEPARRPVEGGALCSWPACRMKILSIALAITGLMTYGSLGSENIMCRKFSEKLRRFCGYTNGVPTEYLYAMATSVGILATMRYAAISRFSGLVMSRLS